MELHFYNCPEPDLIVNTKLPEPPMFLTYQPNFDLMKQVVRDYGDKKNIVIIGHGGSITSFLALAGSLVEQVEQSGKRVHFIETIDPDYLARVKAIAKPDNSVVVAVSKSGETVTQIEAVLQFTDYPMVLVTSDSGALYELGKHLKAAMVLHPVIGGRFTAFTEVALLPAMMCGLDAQQFMESGQKVLVNYGADNNAWRAASIMYQLEQKGIVDVLLPFYNAGLFCVSNLVVQLCHESFGKGGQGQTYFAHEGPEVEHHTLQRFIGGKKDIAGWFHSVQKTLQSMTTHVPDDVKTISIQSGTLGDLDGIELGTALQYECEATLEDAQANGIAVLHTSLTDRSEQSIGELIAFWQLFAVYSAVLRGVDPFNQPQVEASKHISFRKRLQRAS